MKKYKCKSCGKIYDTKPTECSCGGTEFVEVVEEKKEDSVDLEEYAKLVKAETKAELEADLKAKIKAELEADLKAKSKSKDEDIRAAIMKELQDKKDESNKTEEQIEISNLRRLLEEQSDTINVLKETSLAQAEEVKQAKIKNEISKRVKKEPYLEKIVQKYLDNGTIKTLDDYDKVMTSDIRKVYKDKAEFEKQINSLGQDPKSDYSNTNTAGSTNVGNKDWKKLAKQEHQDEINKMFGIRKTK